jgi:hypothetical protein
MINIKVGSGRAFIISQINAPGGRRLTIGFIAGARSNHSSRFALHSFSRGHFFFALFPSQSPQMVMS